MSARVLNATARVLFFIGGLVSLAIAAFYTLLRGSDLPRQSEWVIFALVLSVAGVVNIVAAVLPVSWTKKICRIADSGSLFSLPLRMFGLFAVFFYFVAVALFFTPHEWNLGGFLWTFLLCPVYIIRGTIDPQPAQLLLLFAPIDAALYGAIGTVVGLAWLSLRRG